MNVEIETLSPLDPPLDPPDPQFKFKKGQVLEKKGI